MYGKLFASMFDGSLYGNWQAIITLQQLVILCDAQGVVDMTPQAIAARTSIPLEIITAGLAVLEAPDEYSRTPGNEGRRIERLDPDARPWGWRIVNYAKYRGMVSAEQRREQDRIRQRARRERERERERDNHDTSQTVTESHAASDAVTHNPQSHAKQKQKQKKENTGTVNLYGNAAWECPHDVDPAAWMDWMQVRRRKKAATSERALTAVMAKIEQARKLGLDPSAIVARSSDRGWTDLYLPDARKPASSQQQQVGEFGLFDTTGAFGGPADGH